MRIAMGVAVKSAALIGLMQGHYAHNGRKITAELELKHMDFKFLGNDASFLQAQRCF